MKRLILAGVMVLLMSGGAFASTLFTFYTTATASAVALGFTLDQEVIFQFQAFGTNTADEADANQVIWNGTLSDLLWQSVSMGSTTGTTGFADPGNIVEVYRSGSTITDMHIKVSPSVTFQTPNSERVAYIEVYAANIANFATAPVGTTIDSYFLNYEGDYTPTGITEVLTHADTDGRFRVTKLNIDVVPEPSTYLLLALSGAMLLWTNKRLRQQLLPRLGS
ncbi:MAG: PEP-CTERM sorting domain-containing protein [Verrucomicrobia bacterium]|nr:PEP-CTERM sorting domain-containing protein [Verrucomicrobiota bacterium]